jgi:sec-independent protein translocase protein TatA
MGTLSIWHWLVVLAIVLLLFGGRGKISQLMGDFGKGMKAFKKGLKEEETAEGGASSVGSQPSPSVTSAQATPAQPAPPAAGTQAPAPGTGDQTPRT